MTRTLSLRLLSAAIFIGVFFGLWYGLGRLGLALLSAGVVAVGQWEFSKLAFHRMSNQFRFQILFLVLCLSSFLCALLSIEEALMAFAFLAAILLAFLLWRSRKSQISLDELFRYQSIGLLGLIYCGLFPGCAARLIYLENGSYFFLSFLAVVFMGDTAAFFGGSYLSGIRLFSKKPKLFEEISPQKTKIGALCGLAGSILGGLIFLGQFTELSVWYIVLTSVVTAVFAQTGDLFESLMKRVADVKDSGQIMPGHGGLMDRMDGVYFSAPVFLFFAYLAQQAMH